MPWRKFTQAAGRALKPYTDKKKQRGYKNRMRLYSEVAALKKMVNAEKKNSETAVTTTYKMAQNFGAASGARILSVMPTISQGSSEDQRNGDSLKVCSLCMQFEVRSNSFNTLQSTRYKFYLVRQPINPTATDATALAEFLEPNTFSGVIDYNSNRNYQHMRDWVVVGTASGIIKQNTNDSLNQIQQQQKKIARKTEFHVRFDKGTNSILQNNLRLIAVADAGDWNGTNYIEFQYSCKVYYYDN